MVLKDNHHLRPQQKQVFVSVRAVPLRPCRYTRLQVPVFGDEAERVLDVGFIQLECLPQVEIHMAHTRGCLAVGQLYLGRVPLKQGLRDRLRDFRPQPCLDARDEADHRRQLGKKHCRQYVSSAC